MEYKFIEELIDKKNLCKSEVGVNNFLLENNSTQIEKIINFLKSDKPLLLVSGFLGTGKNQIITHSLTFKSPETIVLEYSCFETTVLDDILLAFFEDFRILSAQNIISNPKTKSENFAQKISAYFETNEKPIIIVLNAFQEILKDNKTEILNFITHLSKLAKVKIILISRVFSLEDFEKKINYEKIAILALEKNIFEKYLRSSDIKQIGPISDEFYKYTRGYYFYTTLSIKLMKLRKLSLTDFMTGYNKSFLSYNDFILREALALVDPVSGHLFRLLTILRHPVSAKLLKTLHLYEEEKINFFVDNMILSRDNSLIYLQDYFKDISENSIPENIATKLHKGCVELYQTQLPLKPFERDLLISRQTMRREIEYHSNFIPKRPMMESKSLSDIAMQEANVLIKSNKTTKPETNLKQEKDIQLENMSFIFESQESSSMLSTIADSIQNYIVTSDKKAKEEEEIIQLSLVDLINLAKQEEQNYNFKKVVTIYQRALTFKNDDDYYTFLPTLLTKLANAYQNMSDWFSSLEYYEKAQDFFSSTGDTEKINEIKWEIAHIYFITFKRDQAKELLSEILKSDLVSNSLKIKTYMLLSSILNSSTNIDIIYEYYKQALELVDSSIDKSILSELYYKFALALDEKNEPENAIKFYKKCIDIDSNPKINTYLSSALSNIATIFEEVGKIDLAKKYHLESLKIDELTNNLNGIYLASMKLADIYKRKEPELAVDYYKKAEACALELNEPFYIATTDLALGDFYYNKKEDSSAIKYYINAYNLAKETFSKDNIAKIQLRLNDIKIRVGEVEYKNLVSR